MWSSRVNNKLLYFNFSVLGVSISAFVISPLLDSATLSSAINLKHLGSSSRVCQNRFNFYCFSYFLICYVLFTANHMDVLQQSPICCTDFVLRFFGYFFFFVQWIISSALEMTFPQATMADEFILWIIFRTSSVDVNHSRIKL